MYKITLEYLNGEKVTYITKLQANTIKLQLSACYKSIEIEPIKGRE